MSRKERHSLPTVGSCLLRWLCESVPVYVVEMRVQAGTGHGAQGTGCASLSFCRLSKRQHRLYLTLVRTSYSVLRTEGTNRYEAGTNGHNYVRREKGNIS